MFGTFGLRYSADASGGGDATVVESAPIAESAPASEPAPAAPAPEPEPPATTEPEPEPWNGEIEHIAKQPWFTSLDEPARKSVEGGLREKWKNLEAGYNRKFNELAENRKAFEKERATPNPEWEAEKARLLGDLDSTRRALEEAKNSDAIMREIFGADDAAFAAKIEAAKVDAVKPYEEKVKAWEPELTELRAFKAQVETERKAQYEAMVSEAADRLREKLVDILPHQEAMDKFERLLAAGEDEDDAIKFVRSKYGIKRAEMPESAVHASRGDGPVGDSMMPEGMSLAEKIEWAASRAARKLNIHS